MLLKNSRSRFGAIAQLLHWLIAGLIAYQYVLAQLAEDASLFQRLVIIARHKSLGITIFALALIRLSWKLANPAVEAPPGQPRYQRRIASMTHSMMYALIFALPLTGLLMSAAANVPVSYFGWFTLPPLLEPDEAWVEPLERVHAWLFYSLFVVVVLHAGAALYHHFLVKDDVLTRMLPYGGGRSE